MWRESASTLVTGYLIVNPLARLNVTSPMPGGPGNTTETFTAPGVAVLGMLNVAVTFDPDRETLVPLMVPRVAEVG